ncbi:MAG TPA: site-specific integrase [Terriglobales bacterium]|nr:site-specific integrase [Terriglobales bacterium]
MLPLYKPSTRHFITTTAYQICRTFGKRRLADISTEILQSYVSILCRTPKTTANRMTVFRTMWKSARTWGYVNHDPFVGLVLPKLLPPETRCFTLAEVNRIVRNSCEPYRTLYLLAAETGMRAGELCALHWDDVNLADKTINVAKSVWKGQITTPKTRAGRRVICISGELVDALSRLKKSETGIVFTRSGGRLLDPEKVVQNHLQPLLKRLGIEGGGLHAFRHFNATVMDRESVPMKTRQSRLGHSSPQTTLQLYTHVLNEEDRRTAANISRHLTEQVTNETEQKPRSAMFWWASTVCVQAFVVPSKTTTPRT